MRHYLLLFFVVVAMPILCVSFKSTSGIRSDNSLLET